MHKILGSLRSLWGFSWASWMNKITKIVLLANLFNVNFQMSFFGWSTMTRSLNQKHVLYLMSSFGVIALHTGKIKWWFCSQSCDYQVFWNTLSIFTVNRASLRFRAQRSERISRCGEVLPVFHPGRPQSWQRWFMPCMSCFRCHSVWSLTFFPWIVCYPPWN